MIWVSITMTALNTPATAPSRVDTPHPHPANSTTGSRSHRHNETLAKFDLFRSLSPQAISELDTQCIWRKYSANEWIAEYHEDGSDVFFLQSGIVRLKIPSTVGREVLFHDLSAGSYFGEVDAIDGKPRAIGIQAQTDVVIARMPRTVFRATMLRYPDAADQMLRRLTGIIRSLTNRVREFSTLDVKYRVYAELLRLSQPRPGKTDQAAISPPPVQAAIAARVSTRRETVAREMKALERDGLIERKRGVLVLTDTKRLQCMIKCAADCDGAEFNATFFE